METAKVEFIDTSKECVKMMQKLSKDGLKKGGKIVTDILKSKINVRTGGLKKSIVAWAKIDYKTGQPYMEVGYRSRSQMKKKYGIKYFVNPAWFEFGVVPHNIQTKELKNKGYSKYKLADNAREYGFSVQHPGMPNKNFLRNTVFDNVEEINNAIQDGLKELENYAIENGMNIDLGKDEEIG